MNCNSCYTQMMFAKKPLTMVLCFLTLGALACTVQNAFAQGSDQVLPDSVFPEHDVFRQVTEPLGIGTDQFAQRLARVRASGREPVGLVLTGGSARAYAHIGVLEALEAEGIRPDFIVANSMGALIGMFYAAGMSPQTIAQVVQTMPPEQYLDIVLPIRGGLLDSANLQSLVRTLVGDVDLSDLPIPILVITEDLKSRRQVELAAGDFSKVLAASFALPAVFEPVSLDDLLLIDGGVTNLVPVATAARYTSRLIVSTALYDRPMDFGNPITVINRAFDIGKTRSGMEEIFAFTPLVIRNDVETISYMAFSDPSLIIEQGRKSAQSCIESIKANLESSVEVSGGNDVIKEPETDRTLEERRKFYATQVPLQLSLLSSGALPASNLHWNLQPTLKVADRFVPNTFEPESLGLTGQAYAGLSFDCAVGKARYGLSTLFGLGAVQGKAWTLGAQALLNPVSTLRLSGAVRLWGDFVPLSSYGLDPKSIEASVGISWSSASQQSLCAFVPRFSASAKYSLDTSGFDWQTGLGLESQHEQRQFLPRIHTYTGFFADSASNTIHYGPEGGVKLDLALEHHGALRLRGASRFDISRQGLELTDDTSFRGKVPQGSSDWVGIVNTEAVWFAKPLEFSAGEALLVSDIQVGPYFDSAWAGSGSILKPDTYAVGISISASASLFGLKPTELSVFCGVDNFGSLIFGLREGRLF